MLVALRSNVITDMCAWDNERACFGNRTETNTF